MLSARKILFLTLAIFATTSLAAITEPNWTFILPINATVTPKVSLSVDILNSFAPLKPAENFYKSKNSILQFVPKGEDEKNWTRMVTVEMKVGKKISAKAATANMMAFLQKNSDDLEILENKVIQTDAYQEARLGVMYKFQQHHEMIYFVFYSGPDDLSSIQYAVVMKPKQAKETTFKELKTAVKNMSSVV